MKKWFFILCANFFLIGLISPLNAFEIIEISHLEERISLEGEWQIRLYDTQTRISAILKDDQTPFHAIPNMPGNFMPYVKEKLGEEAISGIAHFQIHLYFSSDLSKQPVGYNSDPIKIADKIYFNGVLIGSTGRFPPDYFSAWNVPRQYIIPPQLIQYGEENVLDIIIYYNSEGAINGQVYVMNQEASNSFHNFQSWILNKIHMIITAMLLTFGLYYLLLFILRRERESLLFFIVALLQAVDSSNQFVTYNDFPFAYLIKDTIVFMSRFWMAGFMIIFLQDYFNILKIYDHGIKHKIHKYLGYFIFAGAFAFSIPLIFAGDLATLFWMMEFVTIYLLLPILYIIFVMILVVLKKQKYGLLFVFTMLIIIGFAVNDIVIRSVFGGQGVFLFSFGMPLLVFSIALSLGHRFITLHNQFEDLNVNLERKVEERTKELQEVLNKAHHLSTEIKESEGSITQSMSHIDASMENLNHMSQQINDDMEKQTSFVDKTAHSIEIMIDANESITHNLQKQISSITDMKKTTQALLATMQELTVETQDSTKEMMELKTVAENGEEVILRTSDAIKLLEQSSNQASDMIMVIGKIAEQVNLLAMNAAIEAAHAGEMGKGFSVVADEVRKLAESSTKSAKEIINIIKDMVNKVKNSVELTEQAGQAFVKIITGINHAVEANAKITDVFSNEKQNILGIEQEFTHILSITGELSEHAVNQKIKSIDISKAIPTLQESTKNIRNASEYQLENTGKVANEISEIRNQMNNALEALKELDAIISGKQTTIETIGVNTLSDNNSVQ